MPTVSAIRTRACQSSVESRPKDSSPAAGCSRTPTGGANETEVGTHLLLIVASTILLSCRLAPSTASSIGTPDASLSKLRFTPFPARSVGFGPVPPSRRGLGPFLESIVSRAAGADARRVQGVPLTAGPQHKEDSIHTREIGSSWPTAAETVRAPIPDLPPTHPCLVGCIERSGVIRIGSE